MTKFKALSLFSNVGIAETYFERNGVKVVIANELLEERVNFYKHLYPNTNMIMGDITKKETQEKVLKASFEANVDFIIATPPCQGMSIAGKRERMDPRNQLIYYAIEFIKKIKPKYVFLENVPQTLTTKILVNNDEILIRDYIYNELKDLYIFSKKSLVSAMEYGVPQMRKRNIFLLSRNDQKYIWEFPEKEKVITLKDAIYHLPPLDPLLKEGYDETIAMFPDFEKKKEAAAKISIYHRPPKHAKKHVLCMMHTPSGKTAFDNEIYYPKKNDGTKVNGHYNTYRRLDWNKPSRTITQNNGVISSLCCVHPGRQYTSSSGETLYSDPRCLSLYELFIVTSLPNDWNPPEWASETTIRKVIGEGIPPLFVEKIIKNLIKNT